MKKIIKQSMDGILIDEEKSIKKAPRKYIPGVIEQYIRERELSINDEKSKIWLKEHES